MRQKPGNRMRAGWIAGTLVTLILAGLIRFAQADPLLTTDRGHDLDAMQALHKAQHEVDRAWEAFHKAALGGTLASPAVQTDIEQALHDSRSLLVKAREAADRGDQTSLRPLLNRIDELTKRAIEESQEQKR